MRDKIVKAVIEVVEEGLRSSAPREISDSDLDKMLIAGRPSLKDTAEKIADRVLND